VRPPAFRWGSEPAPERPWGPWLVAVALHLPLLAGWITGRTPDEVHRRKDLISLAPIEAAGKEVRIPIPRGVPDPARSKGVTAPRSAIYDPPPPARPHPLADRSQPASAAELTAPARRMIGRLGPGIGDGKLWVEPLPLAPRQLASILTQRPPQELLDSFVTAVVQAYLDSIVSDPYYGQMRPPSWVANVAGTKFGIDASSIYIAGLKIPTALLALLPIKASGNQATMLDHDLENMATDLRIAGARSNNLDDFKRAVRQMRERREAEREFERNRERAPSDTLVGSREH
jgi:hypothetical protein